MAINNCADASTFQDVFACGLRVSFARRNHTTLNLLINKKENTMTTLKDLIPEAELKRRFKHVTTKLGNETLEQFFLDGKEIYSFTGRDAYWNNMRLYDTHWDKIKAKIIEGL